MRAGQQVVIDALRGQAHLGRRRVPVCDAGPGGALRIGGEAGPVLRPVTFAERSRAAARARGTPQPVEALCADLLSAATVRAGQADQAEQEVLALALAGAGEEAPPFAEALLAVARATGWSLDQLEAAEAAEVDRLALHLQAPPAEAGWSRLVLAATPGDEVASLRSEMAERLLRRATPARSTTDDPADHVRRDPTSQPPARNRGGQLLPAAPRLQPTDDSQPEPILSPQPSPAARAPVNDSHRPAERLRFALAPRRSQPARTLAAPANRADAPFIDQAVTAAETVTGGANGSATDSTVAAAAPWPAWAAQVAGERQLLLDSAWSAVRPAPPPAMARPAGADEPASRAAAPGGSTPRPLPPWHDADQAPDWAAALAQMLEDEIDLRGLER